MALVWFDLFFIYPPKLTKFLDSKWWYCIVQSLIKTTHVNGKSEKNVENDIK